MCVYGILVCGLCMCVVCVNVCACEGACGYVGMCGYVCKCVYVECVGSADSGGDDPPGL